MRFVPTKTPEQQSCLMIHRTRHLFIRQQTAIINSIRAHLAEFGIVAPVGRRGVEQLLKVAAQCRAEQASLHVRYRSSNSPTLR
jgi:transposase